MKGSHIKNIEARRKQKELGENFVGFSSSIKFSSDLPLNVFLPLPFSKGRNTHAVFL